MRLKFNHEEIAGIAYQAWLERGQPLGTPDVDWYYAMSIVSDPEDLRVGPADQASEVGGNDGSNSGINDVHDDMQSSSSADIESTKLTREPARTKKRHS